LKVLITGGKGLLEPAIIGELGAEHQVYLMGTEPPEADVDFIQCDILNMEAVQQAVKGMEAIVHLSEMPHSGAADPAVYEQQELDFRTRSTYYLLRAAVSEGIQKFVYRSCLSVFDSCPEDWAVTEDWLPRPKAEASPMAKYLGESVCREFARESNITAVCLRLGEIIYEGRPPGKSFDPLWVDVRDVAHAFSMALKVNGKRSRFNVFHILADNPDARFSISKAKQELSYQPEHNFMEVS